MILRGGENVYPFEIEQRLEAHPDVAEAAVIGVEHEELGQEVKAIIVFEAGRDLPMDELRNLLEPWPTTKFRLAGSGEKLLCPAMRRERC